MDKYWFEPVCHQLHSLIDLLDSTELPPLAILWLLDRVLLLIRAISSFYCIFRFLLYSWVTVVNFLDLLAFSTKQALLIRISLPLRSSLLLLGFVLPGRVFSLPLLTLKPFHFLGFYNTGGLLLSLLTSYEPYLLANKSYLLGGYLGLALLLPIP